MDAETVTLSMIDNETNATSFTQYQDNDDVCIISSSDVEDINSMNNINIHSKIDDNSINPNNPFEGMDIYTIADYIDDICHNVIATMWTCQLLFMGKTIYKEYMVIDILQFNVVTQYKHTKKRGRVFQSISSS